MGKYLVLWELDQSKVPISPQERGAGWSAFLDIIKEHLEENGNMFSSCFVETSSSFVKKRIRDLFL
jgi:hypothetical protein